MPGSKAAQAQPGNVARHPQHTQSGQQGSRPKDVVLIEKILTSMGIDQFEPRVVNMLVEFMHRYVGQVSQEAHVYADHAGRTSPTVPDVRLATQAIVNFSFTNPPPREFLVEIAAEKNAIPLPLIPERLGVHLPPDRYCLTQANHQVDTDMVASAPPPKPSPSAAPTTFSGVAPGGASAAPPAAPITGAALAGADVAMGLKRKAVDAVEDDDYD